MRAATAPAMRRRPSLLLERLGAFNFEGCPGAANKMGRGEELPWSPLWWPVGSRERGDCVVQGRGLLNTGLFSHREGCYFRLPGRWIPREANEKPPNTWAILCERKNAWFMPVGESPEMGTLGELFFANTAGEGGSRTCTCISGGVSTG